MMMVMVVVAAESKAETQKWEAQTISVTARVAIVSIRNRASIVIIVTVVAGIVGTEIRLVVVVVVVAMMTEVAISEVAVMTPIVSIILMMMLLLVVRYVLNEPLGNFRGFQPLAQSERGC